MKCCTSFLRGSIAVLLLTAAPAWSQSGGEEDTSIAAIEAEAKARLRTEQRRLVARYADDLAALQKAQQAKGDTAGAAAAGAELARARAALAEGGDPAAFLAGPGKKAEPAVMPADAPEEVDPSRRVITLRPESARSLGGGPAWTYSGTGKVWTLTDIPAGLYTLHLSTTVPEGHSGKLQARLGADQRLSANFASGTHELKLGRVSVTTVPVELFLVISSADYSSSSNASLDVRSLTLRPVKLGGSSAPK